MKSILKKCMMIWRIIIGDKESLENAYATKGMEILHQIIEFADEHGEDRKEFFIIFAKMLKGTSERIPDNVIDYL